MDYVQLGRTDLKVSRLALGGLFVSSVGGEYEQGRAAIHRALELGVNFIDTAPGYANSEEVIGKALADVEAPVILSTKLGGFPKPFQPQDRDSLRASVEQSLRLLGRDQIDMLLIHEPDRPKQYAWWTDWEGVAGPVLDVFDELKAAGTIRYTGLGGTTAYEMRHLIRSGKFDVLLTALNYSILWREAEREVIPAAVEQGMGIIIGSPLQQGALSARFDRTVTAPPPWLSSIRSEQFRLLYKVLDDIDMSLPELAIRFVLSNPAVHTVLMGARSVEEVEQNVAATNRGALPTEIQKRLDTIAAMVPFRPYEEPFAIGWHMADPSSYQGPGWA